MKRFNIETGVGIFMLIGFICFSWISIKLGKLDLFGEENYPVNARFSSVSGLKEGAVIEIAGVSVGKVSSIKLDSEDFEAVVELTINKNIKLQEDSIASIRTAGIIGDRYINISPGGLDEFIEPGGEIEDTESAINLEELVSKYIFESK